VSDGTLVFVIAWERPVYLWASLDSLYRTTRSPHRFVLIDNASQDPLVGRVIEGFERRGLFHAVHRMDSNDPANVNLLLDRYRSQVGDLIGYVEGDTVIEPPAGSCWLDEMTKLMAADPKLAMLGSYCDPRDFVDVASARHLFPDLSEEDYLALVKASSPERHLPVESPAEPVISPFNPPGRLCLFRSGPLLERGFQTDYVQHLSLLESGWKTGISTQVRHRHLSLLHVYDEPAYDTAARVDWFARYNEHDWEPARTPLVRRLGRRLSAWTR
jgi:hypothetical protein